MKKSLTLFSLLLLGTAGLTNHVKAQDNSEAITACLHDEYGYVWNVTATHSGSLYTGKGTVDVAAGFLWDATVTYDRSTGATSLRADNPQADGCASGYTDYFQYDGTAKASLHGGVVTYSGSGTWQSYCSGVAINSGDWDATDCAHKGGAIDPNGPAKSATGIQHVNSNATSITKAEKITACLHDEYGYVWNVTATHSGSLYTGKGTVDVAAGFLWDATVTYDRSTGATSLRADNPQADGCASGYTDYFQYDGTAKASLHGGVVTYSGSGTWQSYCSGVAINSGDWDATDCAHKGGVIDPNGPANHAVASQIKVSPNPINSQANVSYSVGKSGNVNITVYNSMQQVVKVLVNGYKNAGNYTAVWDTRSGNINSGVYRVVAVVNGKTVSSAVQVVR